VKDQSHKEEMSKALRGDFERLRGRGVAATLAPRDEPSVPEAAEPERVETSSEVVAPQPVADDPPAEAVASPESGWLGRLFGR
jgi:hypothetical protein